MRLDYTHSLDANRANPITTFFPFQLLSLPLLQPHKRPLLSYCTTTLPYTPNEFPQIAALNPLLLAAASHTKTTTSSAANTPSLAYIADDSGRAAANDRSRGNDHVGWDDGVRQDLDVFLDNSKGPDGAVLANVNMRGDGDGLDS